MALLEIARGVKLFCYKRVIIAERSQSNPKAHRHQFERRGGDGLSDRDVFR
jgi:hypothetical protein